MRGTREWVGRVPGKRGEERNNLRLVLGVCDEGEVNHDAIAGAVALVASGEVPVLPFPSRRVLKRGLAWEMHGRGARASRCARWGESRESRERKERRARTKEGRRRGIRERLEGKERRVRGWDGETGMWAWAQARPGQETAVICSRPLHSMHSSSQISSPIPFPHILPFLSLRRPFHPSKSLRHPRLRHPLPP